MRSAMKISNKALCILAAFMIGLSGLADGSEMPNIFSTAEARDVLPLPDKAPPKLKEVCNAINKSGCRKMVITPLPGGEGLCTLYDKDGNCIKNAIMPLPGVDPRKLQPYLKPEIKVNKPIDPQNL